ncbi:RNA-binding protein, partial [gut metagenome]
ELGTSSDQLDIQVITEGSSGLFGIGRKPAIIRVRKKETVSEEKEIEELVEAVKIESIKEEKKPAEKKPIEKKPASKPVQPKETKEVKEAKEKQSKPVKEKKEKPAKEKQAPKEKQVKEKLVKVSKPIEIITDPEEIKAIEERAVAFLRDVFGSMNLGEVEITSKYNTSDGCLEVDFEGEDMGILIGKRGQTLDSLQYLTSLVVNKGRENYIRVKLDTEDYRRRRKETLENLARGIAYKVKKTRKPVVLEPMNPYERRIIHSALQGNKFVETVSEGEEP